MRREVKKPRTPIQMATARSKMEVIGKMEDEGDPEAVY